MDVDVNVDVRTGDSTRLDSTRAGLSPITRLPLHAIHSLLVSIGLGHQRTGTERRKTKKEG